MIFGMRLRGMCRSEKQKMPCLSDFWTIVCKRLSVVAHQCQAGQTQECILPHALSNLNQKKKLGESVQTKKASTCAVLFSF